LPQPREDVGVENHMEVAARQEAGSAIEDNPGVHSPQRRTRTQHGISKPKIYKDGTIRYAGFACVGSTVLWTMPSVTHGGNKRWIVRSRLFIRMTLGILCSCAPF
jgi:hypothetical protein